MIEPRHTWIGEYLLVTKGKMKGKLGEVAICNKSRINPDYVTLTIDGDEYNFGLDAVQYTEERYRVS